MKTAEEQVALFDISYLDDDSSYMNRQVGHIQDLGTMPAHVSDWKYGMGKVLYRQGDQIISLNSGSTETHDDTLVLSEKNGLECWIAGRHHVAWVSSNDDVIHNTSGIYIGLADVRNVDLDFSSGILRYQKGIIVRHTTESGEYPLGTFLCDGFKVCGPEYKTNYIVFRIGRRFFISEINPTHFSITTSHEICEIPSNMYISFWDVAPEGLVLVVRYQTTDELCVAIVDFDGVQKKICHFDGYEMSDSTALTSRGLLWESSNKSVKFLRLF